VDGRPPLTGARNRRALSAALALAVNVMLLSLLASPGRDRLALPAEGGRPVDVSVVPMPAPQPSVPPKATPRRSRTLPTTASVRAPLAVGAPQLAATAPKLGSGPPAATGAQALSAALRGGPIGCANQAAAWMSDAERDACRQRLAAGAANVPYLHGMAPEKLAYYNALAKAQQDWLDWRDVGHLPYVYCGLKFGGGRTYKVAAPPHALTFGPCFLEPPKGSLSVTVDVPPPDHLSPDAVGPIAGQDPIRHQGQ